MHVDARFGFESSEYSFSEGPGLKSVVVVLLEHELTLPVSVQFTVTDLSACELVLHCIAVYNLSRYMQYSLYLLNALHLSCSMGY